MRHGGLACDEIALSGPFSVLLVQNEAHIGQPLGLQVVVDLAELTRQHRAGAFIQRQLAQLQRQPGGINPELLGVERDGQLSVHPHFSVAVAAPQLFQHHFARCQPDTPTEIRERDNVPRVGDGASQQIDRQVIVGAGGLRIAADVKREIGEGVDRDRTGLRGECLFVDERIGFRLARRTQRQDYPFRLRAHDLPAIADPAKLWRNLPGERDQPVAAFDLRQFAVQAPGLAVEMDMSIRGDALGVGRFGRQFEVHIPAGRGDDSCKNRCHAGRRERLDVLPFDR